MASHQPEPPGLHLWTLNIEGSLLAGTPRPPEPDREETNRRALILIILKQKNAIVFNNEENLICLFIRFVFIGLMGAKKSECSYN